MMDEVVWTRPIGTAWVEVYKCNADFFIEGIRHKTEAGHPVELRNLVVRYGAGYCGPYLPKGDDGAPTFGGQIPDDWTTFDVIALLLTPPFTFEEGQYIKRYPPWEAGARYEGLHYLIRCKRTPKATYDAWCQ
jgi:hypothetical protein